MDIPIIDWEESTKLAGNNIDNAKEFLQLLAIDLKKEFLKMKQAYESKNNKELKYLLHKMQGALSYCSVPRLKAATKTLEDRLNNHKDTYELFQQFENELNEFFNYLTYRIDK